MKSLLFAAILAVSGAANAFMDEGHQGESRIATGSYVDLVEYVKTLPVESAADQCYMDEGSQGECRLNTQAIPLPELVKEIVKWLEENGEANYTTPDDGKFGQ